MSDLMTILPVSHEAIVRTHLSEAHHHPWRSDGIVNIVSVPITISSNDSRKLINQLIRSGYTRSQLVAYLICEEVVMPSKHPITTDDALAISKMHEQLLLVPAIRSRKILDELRAEGFRESRIKATLQILATSLGQVAPDLPLTGEKILARTARLIEVLYEHMTA